MNPSHRTVFLRTILPTLLILTTALSAADDSTPAVPKKFSSISLLPDGSELHDVMFPRYGENHELIGVLKAKAMTLVNNDTLSGESVTVQLFNPDNSPRGRADLVKAVFHQTQELLETRDPVTMQSDRIHAIGTGLFYTFKQSEGFLLGPVTTWIQPRPETPMNSRPSPTRSTALLGISLLTLPLAATPPPAVSPAELSSIQSDAVATASTANQSAAATRADLDQDTRDAAAATDAAKKFTARNDLPGPAATAPDTEAKPLDVKPGLNDTVVTCDGGMYFDTDAGVFVYLKNVRVSDPRYSLSGANELKIFLSKKPEKNPDKKTAKTAEKPAKKTTPGSGLSAKFGEVDRIVATGAVRLVQKPTEAGKEPIEASGAIFTYHTQTGQIILSGGYPWVKQGTSFMRAEQPNLNLRILKSGSFVTEGKWIMGGQLKRP